MMGTGFGDAIYKGMVTGIAILLAIAFTFGALAVWGLPKVWDWIKPIIHAVTG